MIRLLHAHSGNLFGGVESMLLTLVRHSADAPGLDSRFALCFDGRLSDELRGGGASVDVLGKVRTSRPWTVLSARRALRQVLRRDRPDVLACHSAWSQLVFGPVARAEGVPLVFWAHGIMEGRHWLERAARYVLPDAVICNSEFTRSTLASIYPHATAHVLHCPVAAPAPRRVDREALRAQLGVAPTATLIALVGRMEEGKGHAVLLDALGGLASDLDWQLWVVGGAQRHAELAYETCLRERVKRLGLEDRVRFLGSRSDVPDLLACADLYCQPNTRPEGFGITFVEALYAGVPVVTADIGGAREIVDDSCGVRVPSGHVDALRWTLHGLLSDPERLRRLGAGGPARARALTDPSVQLQRLNGLVETILGRGIAPIEPALYNAATVE